MTELTARLLEREAVLLHRIEVLQAEVKAWRKGGVSRQPDDESYDEICEAITVTDASGALEDK